MVFALIILSLSNILLKDVLKRQMEEIKGFSAFFQNYGCYNCAVTIELFCAAAGKSDSNFLFQLAYIVLQNI